MALCEFLDVEGAFDNTSYDSINRALRKKGIDDNSIAHIFVSLDLMVKWNIWERQHLILNSPQANLPLYNLHFRHHTYFRVLISSKTKYRTIFCDFFAASTTAILIWCVNLAQYSYVWTMNWWCSYEGDIYWNGLWQNYILLATYIPNFSKFF